MEEGWGEGLSPALLAACRGDGPFGKDDVVWLMIQEKMHCQALSLESRILETLIPSGLISNHFEPSRHPPGTRKRRVR